jgi:hypothetical protein
VEPSHLHRLFFFLAARDAGERTSAAQRAGVRLVPQCGICKCSHRERARASPSQGALGRRPSWSAINPRPANRAWKRPCRDPNPWMDAAPSSGSSDLTSPRLAAQPLTRGPLAADRHVRVGSSPWSTLNVRASRLPLRSARARHSPREGSSMFFGRHAALLHVPAKGLHRCAPAYLQRWRVLRSVAYPGRF